MVHDGRRQDFLIPDGHGHDLVYEDVEPLDEELPYPTPHHEAELFEMAVVGDGPAPGVGDNDPLYTLWLAAREVQADGSSPVGQEQCGVSNVEVLHQLREALSMGRGVMVLTSFATG